MALMVGKSGEWNSESESSGVERLTGHGLALLSKINNGSDFILLLFFVGCLKRDGARKPVNKMFLILRDSWSDQNYQKLIRVILRILNSVE